MLASNSQDAKLNSTQILALYCPEQFNRVMCFCCLLATFMFCLDCYRMLYVCRIDDCVPLVKEAKYKKNSLETLCI